MKKLLLFIAITAFPGLKAFSQSGLDLVLSPNVSFVSIQHGGTRFSESQFDSIRDIHRERYSLGFELTFVHNINRDLVFQAGLRLNNTGFRKLVNDLQFHDSIHPDVGRVEDLSEAASKDVIMNYNVMFIEIPVRINYRISPESQLFQYGLYISGGLIAQYRIADYINIDLTGFSIDGETSFNRKKSYINYSSFNLGPAVGIRGVYRISKDFWIMAKPEFFVPIGKAANDKLNYRLFQFSGNLGINYTLD